MLEAYKINVAAFKRLVHYLAALLLESSRSPSLFCMRIFIMSTVLYFITMPRPHRACLRNSTTLRTLAKRELATLCYISAHAVNYVWLIISHRQKQTSRMVAECAKQADRSGERSVRCGQRLSGTPPPPPPAYLQPRSRHSFHCQVSPEAVSHAACSFLDPSS